MIPGANPCSRPRQNRNEPSRSCVTRLNTTALCGLGFALLELTSGFGGLSVAGSIFVCVSFLGRLERVAVVSEDDGGALRNFTRAGFDCDGMASHSFDFKAPLIYSQIGPLRSVAASGGAAWRAFAFVRCLKNPARLKEAPPLVWPLAPDPEPRIRRQIVSRLLQQYALRNSRRVKKIVFIWLHSLDVRVESAVLRVARQIELHGLGDCFDCKAISIRHLVLKEHGAVGVQSQRPCTLYNARYYEQE